VGLLVIDPPTRLTPDGNERAPRPPLLLFRFTFLFAVLLRFGTLRCASLLYQLPPPNPAPSRKPANPLSAARDFCGTSTGNATGAGNAKPVTLSRVAPHVRDRAWCRGCAAQTPQMYSATPPSSSRLQHPCTVNMLLQPSGCKDITAHTTQVRPWFTRLTNQRHPTSTLTLATLGLLGQQAILAGAECVLDSRYYTRPCQLNDQVD
jgi:hypothetical protein